MMSDEGHAQEGTVIAHYGIAVGVRFGSGEEVRLPLRRPQKVVVGDRVIFNSYAGESFQVDDDELLLMREDDILAVIE